MKKIACMVPNDFLLMLRETFIDDKIGRSKNQVSLQKLIKQEEKVMTSINPCD